MDVFNALWDNPEQRRRPPDDDFQLFTLEEWFAKSSTHKILNGSFRCPLPPELEPQPRAFERRNDKDKSTAENITPGHINNNRQNQKKNNDKTIDSRTYVPGLLKAPIIDKVSSLSRDEQKDCLRLSQKFDGRSEESLTPSEKAEYQLFQSLFRRVQAEQKEFLDHAKQDWLDYADRTSKIKGDPYNFVLQHWADKVSHAMAQYPKYYKMLRTVSLHHGSDNMISMHHIKNVLNIGKVPVAKLPQFDAPFRVATSLIRLRTWRLLNVPPTQLVGTLHRVPVSRDPNAERLARLHGANVVMSTSAFKCLLDNYDETKHAHHSGVGKSWIIPIIVKQHRSFCEGKPITKTIVFLDKVLPLPRMTKFDKVCTWQKHALLAALIHRHHDGGVEFEVKGDDIMIRKTADQIPVEKRVAEQINGDSGLSDVKKNEDILSTSISSELNSNLNSTPVPAVKTLDKQVPYSCEEDDGDSSDDFELTIAESDEEDKAKKICFSSSENQDLNETAIESMNQIESSSAQTVRESIENFVKHVEPKPKTNSVFCSPTKSIIPSGNKDLNASATKSDAHIEFKESHTVEPAENNLEKSKSKPLLESNLKSDVPNRWENIPAPPPVKVVNGNALPPSTTNVIYNMWSLQAANKENLSVENSSGNISLLIRSRIDGCEMLGSGNYNPLSFAVKPEYQLEYGAGVISLSDLTRQWAKLMIQPDCTLARVRVNVKTSEMVKVEKCSREEIAAEAKLLYNEDLCQTLSTLKGVLSEVMNLSPGEYLLSHTPDMGLAAKIFKASEGNEAVDWCLREGYGALPGEIGSDVPWQPLDTRIILPKNLVFHSMPCTFPPRWAPDIKPKPSKPPKFTTVQNKFKKNNKNKNKNKGKNKGKKKDA